MIRRLLNRVRAKKAPHLPDGVRIYAIGDVHGRADLLDRIISLIDADIVARPIARPIFVFVGDYIDRGPGSRDVIDLLVNGAKGREMVFLRGNHDVFLLNFIENPALLRDWSKIGGLETLMSYGIQPSLNADAATQLVEFGLGDRSMRAHPITSQPSSGRQLQYPRQRAVVGQQQKPLGIEIEPADADEPRPVFGQPLEYRRPSPRVDARGQKAARLVVEEQPRALARRQLFAVDGKLIARGDVAGRRVDDNAVDRNAPCRDPGLRFAARR